MQKEEERAGEEGKTKRGLSGFAVGRSLTLHLVTHKNTHTHTRAFTHKHLRVRVNCCRHLSFFPLILFLSRGIETERGRQGWWEEEGKVKSTSGSSSPLLVCVTFWCEDCGHALRTSDCINISKQLRSAVKKQIPNTVRMWKSWHVTHLFQYYSSVSAVFMTFVLLHLDRVCVFIL